MVFGPFRLDPVSGHLYKDELAVPLAPKAYAVLHHLVANAGRLVSKRELLDAVWPGVFVGDAVLKVTIGEIRKALGDDARNPEYIETSHRRGYRFLAPVARDARPATRPPRVHYAQSGDVNIAYQVVGSGPVDLVFVMGWVSHLEYFWNEPSFAAFLSRLAAMSRLILFDKRGTGLSDAVPTNRLPTLEQRMDDVRAVMEAVGSERAVLMGVSEGGPLCSLFAATYPEKTQALVMIGSYARRLRDGDYPWGPTREERDAFCARLLHEWGGPVGVEDRAPSMAGDPAFRDWWASYLRMGASPGAAVALTRMNAEIDVRPVLPTIRVPTLVLHRTGDRCLRLDEGRYLASRIPGARFVELAGSDHLPFAGDQESLLREVEQFLSTIPAGVPSRHMLATVVTVRCAPGHRDRLRPVFDAELARFRGRPAAAGADALEGFFDGPVRAVRCAAAVVAGARGLQIDAGAGIHIGECDPEADGGPVVEASARLAQDALPGQLLVSRTIVDLAPGSGLTFHPSGRDAFTLVADAPERAAR